MNKVFNEMQDIREKLNLPKFEENSENQKIFSEDMPEEKVRLWEMVIQVKKEILKKFSK